MVGHGGGSAGSYLADPTSSISSHCASIVVTSTLRVKVTEDQYVYISVVFSVLGSSYVSIKSTAGKLLCVFWPTGKVYFFKCWGEELTLKVLVTTIDAQWEGRGM